MGRRDKLQAESASFGAETRMGGSSGPDGRKFRSSSAEVPAGFLLDSIFEASGRKIRSWRPEVPVGPEVPVKFQPCSGIRPFPRSNIQYGFDGLSELGRNLGGSSGGRKFRSSEAELPVMGGSSGHQGRKFRPGASSSSFSFSSMLP